MKIKILQTFDGYPNNTAASLTTYKAGQAVEVPDAFAAMVIGKKLAVAVVMPAVAPVAPVPVKVP